MALGLLVNGQWQTAWTEHNEKGEFQRMSTQFHNWITADGNSAFKAERDRYHLYVSLGCPWANRTAIIWKLKGLEDPIGLSIVDPVVSERGWQFSDYPGCIPDRIYQPINNGVYRAGFATSQAAYETAVSELFAALDEWEHVLAKQPYLCGKEITLADWCLFPTLFRFDLAYYGIFKCNLKYLSDYPHLWNYLFSLYKIPGVKEMCSVEHVKRLYYMGIPEINPNRIVPLGIPEGF